MPLPSLSITGSDAWLTCLNRAICKLGRTAFEDSLFDLVNVVVQVDHCAVFINNNDGTAAHLFTKSKLDEAVCRSLARAYTEQFYTRDPNLAPLEQQLTENSDLKMTLLPHIPARDYDEGYKTRFFTDTGLIDKVSSLLQTRHYTIYCSFYRLKASGRFKQEEFEQLSQILPILTNLIFKHSLLAGQEDKENRPDPIITQVPLSRSAEAMTGLFDSHNKVFARLTGRERQVCLRILQGYSSEAISLDMKVAISTIHTYRKRAYAKLGISSQNELFSLYLEFISLAG
ncbi:MAG: helix-turn-helix transcriptional regulator [Alphaproteobacteria bacterium]|nr:helix-turn-helix transcriptional regulator [Alphaproteobacteria bacterium]